MDLSDRDVCQALLAWLPGQRWFAGKGREIAEMRVVSRWQVPGRREFEFIVVAVDVGHWQVYQIPVAFRDAAEGLIARTSMGVMVDGLTQADVAQALLTWSGDEAQLDPELTPVHSQAQWLQRPEVSSDYRLLRVEQSNTSAVWGDSTIVKWFRMLRPGINPDVEVHAALTAVGCDDVGECYGWINGGWLDPESGGMVHGHLGMIQRFYPDSIDGGALAYQRMTQGRDFQQEARELGRAVARVHQALDQAFGSTTVSDMVTVQQRLLARLTAGARVVPEVESLLPRLRRRIDQLAQLASLKVQRVHGDLHLGQVILTDSGWRILDFEGEPGSPLDDRRAFDTPIRDIAGMLRSFSYIAWLGGEDSYVARRWAAESGHAFRQGYEQVAGVDEAAEVLLDAYLIDKAAYEAVYEARNRPAWVEIPMSALRELAGEG